jgi:hypothetical protein
MSQQPTETSVFDAAKTIVEALKGLDKSSQALAIRFASESLGLSGVATQTTPPLTPQSPVFLPDVRGATHSTDIKQFTAAKDPKSDQQFAAVAAYFYRFEAAESARKDTIDAKTVREAARLAGRRQAKNWAFTLTNAKNSGYLDSAGAGHYRINSVGENLVAIGLPGDESETSAKRRSTRKVKKNTARIKRNGKARR